MLGIGERLRAIRTTAGFSLRELASRAEVSASLLSQIENGKANPSVRSLHSIADALGVTIDAFFPSGERELPNWPGAVRALDGQPPEDLTASDLRQLQSATPPHSDAAFGAVRLPGPLLHRDGRATIQLRGGVAWARLTPASENGIEFLEVTYEPGASSGLRLSHHVGREFGLVLEGELQLELGFERLRLQAGDSVVFDSTTPHRLSNAGPGPMRAIWVVMDPKR